MSVASDVATTGSDAPTMEEELPEPLTFTLQVVSPSVGVASPLSFPHLPATTSIKQLKARIRDVLPSKPVDESQRLIHRGRMLARETETMLDIFGKEELANPQPQTLHLVLRPTTTDTPPIPQALANQMAMVNGIPIPPPPRLGPVPGLVGPQPTPPIAVPNIHGQQPLPGFQHVQQQHLLHTFQQHADNVQNISIMSQRLQQLQRETQRAHQELAMLEQRSRALGVNANAPFPGAIHPHVAPGQMQMPYPPGFFQNPLRPPPAVPSALQNLINQQQRERAAEGRVGVQDHGPNPNIPSGLAPQTASGRASPSARPDHSATYTREGVGPNGERWHVVVNESTTTLPMPHPPQSHPSSHAGSPNPAADIQAMMRNADRFLATQAAQNMLRRSASNPMLNQAGVPGAMPGFSRPGTPGTIPPSATVPAPNVFQNINQMNQLNGLNSTIQAPPDGTVAYLLSSPSGPRGLVISNSETFYTPRHSSRRHISFPSATGQAPAAQEPVGLPEFRNRDRARDARRAARRLQRQENPAARAPHANPGAGALAAQFVPMLWLIIRLVGFVWFFTGGNPSWTRWLMVSSLAIVVFIVNTGIFNGAAEQVWGPIRRHLEALIPLAGPNAALVPAANAAIPQGGAAGNNGPPRRPGELDPAEVAARLMHERRQADVGWFLTQFRRIEHALLLFLASLVPGVGERHIAAREAEANAAEAERQRLIEAANAAENEGGNNVEGTGTGGGDGPGQNQDGQQQNHAPAVPEQPLIEI